ncbi:MAG: rhomboid family intramembrane serine protease [Verrucomicrobiota bacterium]
MARAKTIADNMEPLLREIPARTKRQVMDWSLVLASQEIETTISREESWGLLVAGVDYERAVAAIAQYQKENRGWNWRQKVPGTTLIFHWGGLAPCLLFVVFFVLQQTRIPALKSLGMVDAQKVAAGEWWRLFTAISLHGDAAHLIANVTTGFLLFGMAMARYGGGVALLASFLAGAGGNLAGIFFYHQPHRSLGASGMIMGALGLLAVEGMAAWRTSGAIHLLRRGAAAAILVLVLMGFSEGTDIVAHVGGFIFGAIFGSVLHFTPKKIRGKLANSFCVILLAGATIFTWWLALKS